MKRAIIYVRTKTNSVRECDSTQGQLTACHKYCYENDIKVVKDFVETAETYAGTDPFKKPVFQEALRYCKDPKNDVDVLVVYRLDRLSRSSVDYFAAKVTLSDNGITIQSATETITDSPLGRLMETMMVGMAEYEKKRRRELCIQGMAERKLQGKQIYASSKMGSLRNIDKKQAKAR